MKRIVYSAIFLFVFFYGFSSGKERLYLPEVNENPAEERSNLPLLLIGTGGQTILNEPKITVTLKIIDNGPGKTNGINDQPLQYDGKAGIELRGQSTQMFPKKSYGFETREISGQDLKVSLMGMPEESDWVLYAPYSDKSMLRNAVTYHLGRKMGRWQPGFRFCEVYLNGNYNGVYQLIEKIKRDPARVDISKLTPVDVSGEDVTGGYIFKVDKLTGISMSEYFYAIPSVRFQNARNYAYTYVYPEFEDLVQPQKDYLQNFLRSFEIALNETKFSSPAEGYRKYIDVLSFIDFQIMNELANNVDGYRYSTFFHKAKDTKGGKLFAGPLWDFDLSYGNLNYSWKHQSVNNWAYLNYGPAETSCMHWWARLMQDPQYILELKKRWTELRKGILNTDSVMNYLDMTSLSLRDAVARNFVKWPILGVRVFPNDFVGTTYQSEVDFLKDWITRRLNWIDTQWSLNATGIKPDSVVPGVMVFPDRLTHEVTVRIPENYSGEMNTELFNLNGSKVKFMTSATKNSHEFKINLSSLPPGLYFLRISVKGQAFALRKIIKE